MPFRNAFRLPFLLAFGFCAALCVPPAAAIVTPSPDPAHLSEPALQKALRDVLGQVPAFPYWSHLGSVNQSTGIYLGGGRVLTAAHVGAGVFTTQDGHSYRPVSGPPKRYPNRQGGDSDLLVYRILVNRGDPLFSLPPMTLAKSSPERGGFVLLLGAGGGNSGSRAGSADYRWNEDFRLRWGFNSVSAKFVRPILTYTFATPGFATQFALGSDEAQACPGDSGGGVFVYNREARRWELGGVILAVDGAHGAAAFGDQTYIGDLSILPRKEFPTGILAVR